ncbi:cell division protein FtsK [Segniliparus rotundus DSM] [Mycobacterium shimoidei]|uniref:Cell division protein FtsK [Segniliparus rotundus DSM] n=1 Tax=Mycobacterium shimoidei TaxID=29313 RepID=A0A375Z0Q4_MYCSH|nr:FtsK/SpoIIIE domain-containing protein [Mycobacterium shimoidei]SRX94728.1 cell division protein FtsK [Segniliparus rotundus DSM] [Mycobacterium shimoidei]
MTTNNNTKKTTEDDWFGDLLVGLVTLTGKALWRFALRWPDTAAVLTVLAVTAMLLGLRWSCLLTVVCATGVWGWRLGWPESYQRVIGKPVADYRRAYLVYRRRWRAICEHHGLTITLRGKPDAEPLVPELSSVRIGAAVDTLVVRLLVGQSVKTWQAHVAGPAAAFGAHSVSVRPGRVEAGRGRDIVLRVGHHDALADPIPLARPRPEVPVVRLAQVPVGLTEQGSPWALPVASNHILVGGATGAGKGSVLWSLIAGLAPGIKAGLIAVRCLDPKGGMEFAAGQALFDRFAYDPDTILAVLRDTTATMLARAQRLRGATRCHQPTRAEPHIVLLVDELATLTAYAERKQRAEVEQLLGLWLAHGRAVGVSVIAAVQDPSKDVVALRQLFPVRVGLRVTEVTQTAMILSTAAHQQGARCEEIPDTTPGVGYVLTEGNAAIERVRAFHVTDTDIAWLAANFTPPARRSGRSR